MVREIYPDEIEKLLDITIKHAIDAGLAGHDDVDRQFFKQQLRIIIMNPNYKIFVAEKGNKFIGYIIGKIGTKIWNKKKFGDVTFIFVDPEYRSKTLSDELFDNIESWFSENGCLFMLASCMTYNSDYTPYDNWLNRAGKFFESKSMNEVGHHYIKKLDLGF